MAEPKKKLSKTRTNRRRAQYKIEQPAFTTCQNCDRSILLHTVCPHCGYYKGQPVASRAPTKRIVLDANTTSETN